jgi:hypothetical protein
MRRFLAKWVVQAVPKQPAFSVIASEAKQSIAPQAEEWIASSLRSLAQTLRVCCRQ